MEKPNKILNNKKRQCQIKKFMLTEEKCNQKNKIDLKN